MFTEKNKLAIGYALATVIAHDHPHLQSTQRLQSEIDKIISGYETDVKAHNLSNPFDKIAEITINSRDGVIKTTIKLEYAPETAPRGRFMRVFSSNSAPQQSTYASSAANNAVNELEELRNFYNFVKH